MKILWISHLLPYPPKGGVRIRSYYLLREVCKENDVYFIGLFQKSHQGSTVELEVATEAIRSICKSVWIFPFESFSSRWSWYFLVIRSLFSWCSYKEFWAKAKTMRHEISKVILDNQFDVVHFDTISLLQYKQKISHLIPIVINHHNVESDMMERRAYNQKNIFKKLYFSFEALKLKRLEKEYCPQGVNLVVSQLDKERLDVIHPNLDIEVIPNGVDLDYFQPVASQYLENSLIWVGGLTWYPNLDAVMYFCKEIWPLLLEKVGDAKLVIVGRNPPDSLEKMVDPYDNVHLLGFVDDIRPLMSSVSGCICPMRDGGGTRLKVLNALAMGVPLVATSMACEGVPVIHGKHVLLAENPYQFVECIIEVFEKESLRKRLASNSRKLVEGEFNIEAIGQKLNLIYRDVCI